MKGRVRMKKLFFLMNIIMVTIFVGCGGISTLPCHVPIYPANGDDVVYTLETSSSSGINKIKLFETVSTINSSGTIIPGTETLLQEWAISGSPTSYTQSFTKNGGYSTNRLVNYRFEVTNGNGSDRTHDVTFAIRPYPVTNQPAPVYVQGDVDYVFDIVFIPDTDITDLAIFRSHCRSMITDAMFDDHMIRFWNRQFNFYINPARGTATDYDRISTDGTHQVPSNWANLSFAEAKVLMHQNNLRDYASGGLFSTEQQNRGTMLHEGGHSLFDLADEYSGGAHWQAAELPNNWSTLAVAQSDASGRHKSSSDARQIGSTSWYKICADNCQMNKSGPNHVSYDEPCDDRLIFTVLENATNP